MYTYVTLCQFLFNYNVPHDRRRAETLVAIAGRTRRPVERLVSVHHFTPAS